MIPPGMERRSSDGTSKLLMKCGKASRRTGVIRGLFGSAANSKWPTATEGEEVQERNRALSLPDQFPARGRKKETHDNSQSGERT